MENLDIQPMFVRERFVRLMLLLNLFVTFINIIGMVVKYMSVDPSLIILLGNMSSMVIVRHVVSMDTSHKIEYHRNSIIGYEENKLKILIGITTQGLHVHHIEYMIKLQPNV